MGEEAPWQFKAHNLQFVHFSGSFSSLRILNLENIPNNAPKGHRTRHQKRGLILFKKRITKKTIPINQAVR